MNAAVAALRSEVADDSAILRRRLAESHAHDVDTEGDRAIVALALHHAYSALEALLERLVRHFDGGVPSGADSHRALLARASIEVAGVRPRLLSESSLRPARELLRFRHFLHHDYGADLDASQLRALQASAAALDAAVVTELAALDAWLAEVAAAG